MLYFCIFLSACSEVEGVRQEEKEGGRGREEESVLLRGSVCYHYQYPSITELCVLIAISTPALQG